MYLHLELKTVPTELRAQAVDRLARLHRLMSETDGFISAQIWSDMSVPLEMMVTRAWRDAAAHGRYRSSDAAKAFAAHRPPVPLWENTAVQEWESTAAIDAFGTGAFLIRGIASRASVGDVSPLAEFRSLTNDQSDNPEMTLWRLPDQLAPEWLAPTTGSRLYGYELVDEISK
jgi:quinol monooxygenase YgiN